MRLKIRDEKEEDIVEVWFEMDGKGHLWVKCDTGYLLHIDPEGKLIQCVNNRFDWE